MTHRTRLTASDRHLETIRAQLMRLRASLGELRADPGEHIASIDAALDRVTLVDDALGRARADLQNVVLSLTDGLVLLDGDARIVKVNSPGEALLGASSDALRGRHLRELVGGSADLVEALPGALPQGYRRGITAEVADSAVTLSITAVDARDGGRPRGFVCILKPLGDASRRVVEAARGDAEEVARLEGEREDLRAQIAALKSAVAATRESRDALSRAKAEELEALRAAARGQAEELERVTAEADARASEVRKLVALVAELEDRVVAAAEPTEATWELHARVSALSTARDLLERDLTGARAEAAALIEANEVLEERLHELDRLRRAVVDQQTLVDELDTARRERDDYKEKLREALKAVRNGRLHEFAAGGRFVTARIERPAGHRRTLRTDGYQRMRIAGSTGHELASPLPPGVKNE